jgi:hypothetical protein
VIAFAYPVKSIPDSASATIRTRAKHLTDIVLLTGYNAHSPIRDYAVDTNKTAP